MAIPASDLRLDCIAPSLIPEAWFWIKPQVERLVKRAHGEFTAERLRSQAESGEILFWVVTSPTRNSPPLATLITRFVDWGEPVCRVLGAAGSLPALAAMWDDSEAQLKALGIKRIVFEGRLGWKILAARGFKQTAIVMEKRLDG